jgi:hypothetical protein
MSVQPTDRFDAFLSLSAALTGFQLFDLHATGVAALYWRTLNEEVRDALVFELLDRFALAASAQVQERCLIEILADTERLGPVAKNIVSMWYLGSWQKLPDFWWQQNSSTSPAQQNVSRVISAETYVGGLVWKAMKVNPMGAYGPGFGSWARPPEGRDNPIA